MTAPRPLPRRTSASRLLMTLGSMAASQILIAGVSLVILRDSPDRTGWYLGGALASVAFVVSLLGARAVAAAGRSSEERRGDAVRARALIMAGIVALPGLLGFAVAVVLQQRFVNIPAALVAAAGLATLAGAAWQALQPSRADAGPPGSGAAGTGPTGHRAPTGAFGTQLTPPGLDR